MAETKKVLSQKGQTFVKIVVISDLSVMLSFHVSLAALITGTSVTKLMGLW